MKKNQESNQANEANLANQANILTKLVQASKANLANLGFTLIEILLVIAIIGILAGAVFAMIGNSDNSKRKAALSTARSVLTYAQECYFNKDVVIAPTDGDLKGTDEGDVICSQSITEWPELSVDECSYYVPSSPPDNYDYEVRCGADIGNIVCDTENGSCKEE